MEKFDIEEPKKDTEPQPKTDQKPAEDQAKDLLAELEKFGVANPDQLAGALTAGKEAGNIARMLGDERQQSKKLAQEIAQLRQAMTQQKPKSNEPPINSDGSIDLKALIRDELRDFYQQDVIGPQQRFARSFYQEMQEVTNDEDYDSVKTVFDQHISSPAVQQKIYSGQTTVRREFERTLRAAYKGLLAQSASALHGFTASRQSAPFVESAGTSVPKSEPSGEHFSNRLKQINEARSKGHMNSDAALENIVKGVLFGAPKT
jgi:hypothetical protein